MTGGPERRSERHDVCARHRVAQLPAGVHPGTRVRRQVDDHNLRVQRQCGEHRVAPESHVAHDLHAERLEGMTQCQPDRAMARDQHDHLSCTPPLQPVPPDRYEIAFADVPVSTRVSFRINDQNSCDENPTGAVTRNIFVNNLRVIQNTTTPGNGDEPGFAFTVAPNGTITQ